MFWCTVALGRSMAIHSNRHTISPHSCISRTSSEHAYVIQRWCRVCRLSLTARVRTARCFGVSMSQVNRFRRLSPTNLPGHFSPTSRWSHVIRALSQNSQTRPTRYIQASRCPPPRAAIPFLYPGTYCDTFLALRLEWREHASLDELPWFVTAGSDRKIGLAVLDLRLRTMASELGFCQYYADKHVLLAHQVSKLHGHCANIDTRRKCNLKLYYRV